MSAPIDKSTWKKVKFGELAQSITERVDDPSSCGMDRYVGLEHLDPGCMTVKRWASPEAVTSTKLKFQPGDVIFGRRRAYQKKVVRADFSGICSAHALVLRARPEQMLPEFLSVFMSSDAFLDRAVQISVGSLSPTVNWGTLAQQEFLVPPIDEQKRIADLLWSVENHADALRVSQYAARHTFTAWADKYVLDKRAGLCVRLDSLAQVNPTTAKPCTTDPFVEMADVATWGTWASSSGHVGARGGSRALAGDVLVARITPCLENGKIAIVPPSLPHTGGSTEFVVVRPLEGESSRFFHGYLCLPRVHRRLVHQMSGSTGRQRLIDGAVESVPVPADPAVRGEFEREWLFYETTRGHIADEMTSLRGLRRELLDALFGKQP